MGRCCENIVIRKFRENLRRSVMAIANNSRKPRKKIVMVKVVISQPMYFPWYGHLEQIQQCDVYVFYDDVQFSRGFFNRVQLKSGDKQRWMTVPLEGGESRKPINQHRPSVSVDWKSSHISLFHQLYHGHAFYEFANRILESILGPHDSRDSLAGLSESSTKALFDALIDREVLFLRSSALNVRGKGTERLVNICKEVGGSEYVTGHGAVTYLEENLFDEAGVDVSVISYGLEPYPQVGGNPFTPYVSSLDLIANVGPDAQNYLSGTLVPWKEFIRGAN